MHIKMKSTAALAALSVMAAGGAGAQTAFQGVIGPAVEHCQAAMPAYDGALRKRPTAIANEGTAPVFLSCGMAVATSGRTSRTAIEVSFGNFSGAPADVSCTLVVRHGNERRYLTKSRLIEAPYSQRLSWSSVADNGGDPFDSPGLSCRLSGQTELQWVSVAG